MAESGRNDNFVLASVLETTVISNSRISLKHKFLFAFAKALKNLKLCPTFYNFQYKDPLNSIMSAYYFAKNWPFFAKVTTSLGKSSTSTFTQSNSMSAALITF